MKRFFLVLWVCSLPGLGRAQVIIHRQALDQLAGAPAAAPVTVVSHHIAHRPVARWRKVVRRVTVKIVPAAPIAPVMMRPVAPAPAMALAEKPAPKKRFMPAPPKTPPVPVAVAKPAPALPALPGAVVVRFSAGAADLPGGSAAALAPVCRSGTQGNMVAVDAYAPANANDPSAAMRLSMSRAFAVRDALTACGVPASHIFARADGAAGDVASARITLARGARN